MAQQLTWRQLLIGLVTLATIIGAALAVLLFARVGALRGDRIKLYVRSQEARGVMKGTEVWLAGQKVGLVNVVRFLPAAADTSHRVVMDIDILEQYALHIRHNSPIQIRAGGSLIGTPVVAIDAGAGGSPHIVDGDTLIARPQGDAETVTSQIAIASRQLPEIIANVKLLNAQLNEVRGTAGAVMNDQEGRQQLEVLRGRATRLTRSATAGTGTIGLALRGGEGGAPGGALGDRARHAMASADSLRLLVSSGTSSVGRFRRDSTLLRSVSSLRAEVSIVKALLAEPRGTAGRAMADSAITRELSAMERELGVLMDDIKRRPQRYIAF